MLVYISTLATWAGEPINGYRHPENIETLWSDEDLAAIGLARPTPFVLPEGKQTVGPMRVENVDGVPAFVYDLEDIPLSQIVLNKRQFYTALALQQFITFEEADDAMAGNALPTALQAIVEGTPDITDAERFIMRGKLLHGVRYLSDDEMVPTIAATQNLTNEEVYGFFQFASQL